MLPKFFRKPVFKLIAMLFVAVLLASLFWPPAGGAQWWVPWLFQGTFANSNSETLPYFLATSPRTSLPSSSFSSSQPQTQGKKKVIGPVKAMVPYEIKNLAGQGEYVWVIYTRNGFDIYEDAPVAETGLAVFTLSAKGEPQLVSRLDLPWEGQKDSAGGVASAQKIVINDDLAFIIQKYPALLWIVDLKDPANPKLLHSLYLEEGMLLDLAVGEDGVYLALYDGEETIIYSLDLNQEDDSDITPFFFLEGKTRPMIVRQGYLYVFGQSPGQGYVFDLQSARPEEPCGSLDLSGESAAWRGNRLYLATGQAQTQSRLQVLDLTNPAQPEVQESVNLLGRELQVLLHNDYALIWKSSVFDTRHYLDILNVADPNVSPQKVATVGLTDRPLSLACGEDCLYALGKSGLWVLDLSNPDDFSWVWRKPIDLSASLLAAQMEQNDYPMLDDSPSDRESTTSVPWEFLQNGWLPRDLWYSFVGSFSPYNSSKSKGYGPVAMAYSSLYDSPNAFGPWLTFDPLSYSRSGSYGNACGAVNLLDGGGSSTSSDCGFLNFPFCSFSSSDCPVPFCLVPPPSVSFY